MAGAGSGSMPRGANTDAGWASSAQLRPLPRRARPQRGRESEVLGVGVKSARKRFADWQKAQALKIVPRSKSDVFEVVTGVVRARPLGAESRSRKCHLGAMAGSPIRGPGATASPRPRSPPGAFPRPPEAPRGSQGLGE